MGYMTRAEILTEGLAVVGRTDLTTRCTAALKSWLRSRYASWPFAFLRQSMDGLALPSGTQSVFVGGGEGGVTNVIQRILNPIRVYTADYGTTAKGMIINLDADRDDDERTSNPLTMTGLPMQFKIRSTISTVTVAGLTLRAWKIIPLPVPNKDYLLAFDYIEMPNDPCPNTTSVPLYPNDQTMIQLVKVRALEYANGASDPDFQAELAVLGQMVIHDQMTEGSVPGTNDLLTLDAGTFR